MTPLPLDFPPLLVLAERAARERYEVWSRVVSALTQSPTLAWVLLSKSACDFDIKIEATMLADLTRGESRDVWARWLAEKVGVKPQPTAPNWYSFDEAGGSWPSDPSKPRAWALSTVAPGPYNEALSDSWAFHDFPEWKDGKRRMRVPGISSVMDPAAALVLAILAVSHETR